MDEDLLRFLFRDAAILQTANFSLGEDSSSEGECARLSMDGEEGDDEEEEQEEVEAKLEIGEAPAMPVRIAPDDGEDDLR